MYTATFLCSCYFRAKDLAFSAILYNSWNRENILNKFEKNLKKILYIIFSEIFIDK